MLAFAITVVVLLVVLNGVFAMSELAVVSSRKSKLQARADRGDKGAAAALKLANDPNRFLSAVQVGITLIGILAGAYGQATIAGELDTILEAYPVIAPYSEALATGFVVICLTYLSLIVGELVPKRLALIFPETLAAVVSRPLTFLAMLMSPFVTLLTFSTAGVLKLLGVRDAKGEAITQEEVETVLAEGTSAGLIEPEEQTIISEVLRLGDRQVRVAMTPRRDVYWVSLSDPKEQLYDEIRNCPYSRIVVTEGDDIDQPLGVLHKKDLLAQVMDRKEIDLTGLVQEPLFLPDTTSVLKVLERFKETPVHMAFVVDEFGSFQGVVTATDLLEMIAGDFPEDHDQVTGATSGSIVRREDGSWLVDGRVDLIELADVLGDGFGDRDGFHTVAGLVLSHMSEIPSEGDTVQLGHYHVEVIDMDERRIDKLLFTPIRKAAD